MAREMMTKRFSAFILIMLLCGGGLLFPLFGEDGKWVIAAQKFLPDTGLEGNAVNTKTAEMLPSDILEKIGTQLVRNVGWKASGVCFCESKKQTNPETDGPVFSFLPGGDSYGFEYEAKCSITVRAAGILVAAVRCAVFWQRRCQ